MKKQFDTFEYVRDLFLDLIRDFEKSGKTTHPDAVGIGREKSAIRGLGCILPDGVGIGSGFVIDSYGGTSSQCDIIIYEKNLCLKFNSEDESNCYYNCESVIAVGEVKSQLGNKELIDSIEKLKKIKNLKRCNGDGRRFRKYLSTISLYGAENEEYEQFRNTNDQIFTFILCGKISTNCDSIIRKIEEKNSIYEYPNMLVSLDGGYIGCGKLNDVNAMRTVGALEADCFVSGEVNEGFSFLLEELLYVIENGRTVAYNPRKYLLRDPLDCVGSISTKRIIPGADG